jgi:organic hydroperoxide reductase OsmC/OhrA
MASQDKKIEYKVDLSWDRKSGGEITLPKGSTLHIDIPKEFGGEGRYLCPDELFFSAVGGCLLTTFLYMHKKLKFNLKDLHIIVNGEIESHGPEGYRVTGALVNLAVKTDAEGRERAQECIELTKKFCHITRSIEKSVPIRIASEVVSSEGK